MNAKRVTKRIFYDCIVCITHLGIKLTKVAVVHASTWLFLPHCRTLHNFNAVSGLPLLSPHLTFKSGVKEHVHTQ